MKTFKGKAVVLTGASGGIGAYIARALAREGATVVGVARNQAALDKICAEVNTLGGKGLSLAYDLQNLAALSDLATQIRQGVGPVDVLINNAAIEKFRPFQDYSLDDLQAMTVTNLLAPMELSRLLLPAMIARKSGHIVNISSGAGKHGAPFNSVYSATKAALINWSEALRLELQDDQIGVSVVCPGVTDAGMFHALEIETSDALKITPPDVVADVVLNSIKQNRLEANLDGFTSKVFSVISQLSPRLSDTILQKVGIVEANYDCAQRQMRCQQASPVLAK
ncbi:MAG: SDR family NAD(P)-dependent oxidoreductase [Cyanobacteria bacterium P01_G01_bin.38]